jgi:acyl-CoA reductase-like NAD-dependent aldehyde dehydrogenase
MTADYRLLIDGQLVEGASRFDVINPATEAVLAQCPKADAAQLEAAVQAARRAFPAWAATTQDHRAALIEAVAEQLLARAADFAHLLTAEQGKPLDQAHAEVMGTVYTLKAFATMRIADKVLVDEPGHRVVEHRTPLGVCAAITPWNFPLVLLANKLGPCLIAGNTLVAKPAPTTPLTTLLLGEILARVLPAGVVNIIADQNELGPLLTSHPDVMKVAFTGSTETGKKVMASAAGTVKRVTLELGGNDAAIVLDDMPPALAAQKVYQGAMTNAGQICVAIKRAYVHDSIHDAFCEEIARLAQAAVVDDGTRQGVTIGPVQNRMQFEKVSALLADARDKGQVLAGGAPLDRPGYFIPPTIVAGLDEDAPLVREEQFGPVLPVLRYSDIDEVIERANASTYGLGGTVWGRDVVRASQIARRIDTGTVWVNQHLAIDPFIPFRGVRQSGLGGELGEAGLLEYTQAHIVNAVELGEQ